MPMHTTRPRQSSSSRQAAVNAPSMRAATAWSPSTSISNTRRPLAAKSNAARLEGLAMAGSDGMGAGAFR
jgi:hypothetical protein